MWSSGTGLAFETINLLTILIEMITRVGININAHASLSVYKKKNPLKENNNNVRLVIFNYITIYYYIIFNLIICQHYIL